MAKAKKNDEEKLNESIQEDLKKDEENSTEANKKDNKTENSKDASDAIEESEEIKSEEEEILNNKLLRLQADFLNYKTRTEKEKISTYSNAICDVILELLPVVDNLERALEADKSDADSFKEGVQMVHSQLMGTLSKKGLKEVEALHKKFDHNVHYGVAFEANDDYDDDIIIDVLQKGYTVNDKLIRPAMVRICKK